MNQTPFVLWCVDVFLKKSVTDTFTVPTFVPLA